MPAPEPPDLQHMARAIDAGLEARARLEADLSAEGARRLRDILVTVSAELMIESSWPMIRMTELLDDALA
jgi:hypothetical protein